MVLVFGTLQHTVYLYIPQYHRYFSGTLQLGKTSYKSCLLSFFSVCSLCHDVTQANMAVPATHTFLTSVAMAKVDVFQ
jgi:hypothetical protein